jgi:cytochrome P450 family 6
MLTETLRKYPVIPFLDHMCCTDYTLPAPTGNETITLPAGTGIYIPILGLHHDPTYFPEPEKFDPDRFTEENKRSRPNYTYIPFGEGPRICIGKYRHLLLQNISTTALAIKPKYSILTKTKPGRKRNLFLADNLSVPRTEN